jgi:hypothetical protein
LSHQAIWPLGDLVIGDFAAGKWVIENPETHALSIDKLPDYTITQLRDFQSQIAKSLNR